MTYSGSTVLAPIAQALRVELRVEGQPITLEEATQPGRPPAVINPARRDYPYLVISFENCLRALGRSQGDLPNWLFPLLMPDRGLRSSCDYVIFCDVDGDLRVLLVELKGAHRDDADEQLANTKLLIDWLLDTIAFHEPHVPGHGAATPAREYLGVIFMESKGTKKKGANGFSWVRHRRMTDLPLTTRPYQACRLADLVHATDVSDPVA